MIRGGGTVSVADVITINGVLLLVFASGDEPYRLVGQDAETFSGLRGQEFTSTSVLMGGNYGFRVPGAGVDLRFANGYMAYSAPGRVMLGGGFRVDDIPLMTLEGGVDGDFDVDRRLFSVHGRVLAEIEDVVVNGARQNRLPGNAHFTHLEDVHFTYRKITWTWEPAGVGAEADWREPAA